MNASIIDFTIYFSLFWYNNIIIRKRLNIVTVTINKKSHNCEEGGALTPSKDESKGKILCFRVQVHDRPRTNLAIWLGDKNAVKQPHYK